MDANIAKKIARKSAMTTHDKWKTRKLSKICKKIDKQIVRAAHRSRQTAWVVVNMPSKCVDDATKTLVSEYEDRGYFVKAKPKRCYFGGRWRVYFDHPTKRQIKLVW